MTNLNRMPHAFLLAAVLSAAAIATPGALAQSLPATRPTALPPPRIIPASALPAPAISPRGNSPLRPVVVPAANTLPAPIAATPTTERPHHAEVTYVDGVLNVRADNSSLNQILRAIGSLTGMKITGGVADQRVFGHYGPAAPPVILATLLDGTGSNMLLREAVAGGPASELILTPRGGGPTPPSPDNSMYADETPALLPQRIYNATQNNATQNNPPNASQTAVPAPRPATSAGNEGPVSAQNNGPVTGSSSGPVSGQNNGPVSPQPLNNVNGNPTNTDPTAINFPTTQSVPISSLPTPSTTASTPGIVDAPNPPPPGSTTSPNPGNVATPEQIYQQLKALQQQQQNSQSTGATPK
jgi:hypothetical protein